MKARRSPVQVKVTTAAVPPIDADAWVRLFVAALLELEGITNVATPPLGRLG